MKSLIAPICFLLLVFSTDLLKSQEKFDSLVNDDTQVYLDTLNPNLLGINIYPVFGVLGGGALPSVKMFIQYKRMYEKFNLRLSGNFTNFNRKGDQVDILKIIEDPLSDSIFVDFRKFYYKVFTYDIRAGAELAFNYSGYRLYAGSGFLLGYHHVKEYYSNLKFKYKNFPITYSPIFTFGENLLGFRQTSFLKAGLDFTFGADISLSQNTVLSIQYTPELVYYSNMNTKINDPDEYFKVGKLPSRLVFIPDYVDLILSIRF